jgi:prepilin peptidase CpaA
MTVTALLPLHVALLCVLLLAAAATDAAWRRVPNAIPVAVLVLGEIAQVISAGPRAALLGFAASAVLLALVTVPWSLRLIGGGDVKLAAACGAWLGFGRMPAFLLATALAGGVVTLAALAWSWGALASASPGGSPESASKIRVPYSMAIGAGTLVAIYWSFP